MDAEGLRNIRTEAARQVALIESQIDQRRYEGDGSVAHLASLKGLQGVRGYWKVALAVSNAELCNRGIEDWPRAYALSDLQLKAAFGETFGQLGHFIRFAGLVVDHIDDEDGVPDPVWQNFLSNFAVVKAIFADRASRPKGSALDTLPFSGAGYTYNQEAPQ